VNFAIPDGALIVLIGPSGAGKSTYAAKHFRPTEVVSSDECRRLVADDENDQAATPAAFRVLHAIVRERIHDHRTTVVDATNVKPRSRKPLIAVARRYGARAVAIVFDVPLEVCLERNRSRPSRSLPDSVVRRQHEQMKLALADLRSEGFDDVHVLAS
jgi:protein phosphatase